MKLDAIQATELVHVYRTTGITYRELGKMFGISKNGAHRIVTGIHGPNSERRVRRLRKESEYQWAKPVRRFVTPLAMKVLWNDYYRCKAAGARVLRPDTYCEIRNEEI